MTVFMYSESRRTNTHTQHKTAYLHTEIRTYTDMKPHKYLHKTAHILTQNCIYTDRKPHIYRQKTADIHTQNRIYTDSKPHIYRQNTAHILTQYRTYTYEKPRTYIHKTAHRHTQNRTQTFTKPNTYIHIQYSLIHIFWLCFTHPISLHPQNHLMCPSLSSFPIYPLSLSSPFSASLPFPPFLYLSIHPFLQFPFYSSVY